MDRKYCMDNKCKVCASKDNLKMGWSNSCYCSEECERKDISDIHGSMPGGKLPSKNWVPHHVSSEISRRWRDSG